MTIFGVCCHSHYNKDIELIENEIELMENSAIRKSLIDFDVF